MKRTRFGKLGEFDAQLINQIIGLLYFDEASIKNYKKAFLDELKKDSYVKSDIEDLLDCEKVDIKDPRQLARFVKGFQYINESQESLNSWRNSFISEFNK